MHVENGSETKAVTVVTNNPSLLIALVPPPAAGVYHVKVVTQRSHSSKLLKECRSTVFPKPLTVS
ncbi:MAG: DUF4469 domain-containing protein [Tannerella sp.]|nr:DUF4469 domain-containing protein [Tannerella sp.]